MNPEAPPVVRQAVLKTVGLWPLQVRLLPPPIPAITDLVKSGRAWFTIAQINGRVNPIGDGIRFENE